MGHCYHSLFRRFVSHSIATRSNPRPHRITPIFKVFSWNSKNSDHVLPKALTLNQQEKALSKLHSGQPWEKVKIGVEYIGQVRALELTYGESGRHPHSHTP